MPSRLSILRSFDVLLIPIINPISIYKRLNQKAAPESSIKIYFQELFKLDIIDFPILHTLHLLQVLKLELPAVIAKCSNQLSFVACQCLIPCVTTTSPAINRLAGFPSS